MSSRRSWTDYIPWIVVFFFEVFVAPPCRAVVIRSCMAPRLVAPWLFTALHFSYWHASAPLSSSFLRVAICRTRQFLRDCFFSFIGVKSFSLLFDKERRLYIKNICGWALAIAYVFPILETVLTTKCTRERQPFCLGANPHPQTHLKKSGKCSYVMDANLGVTRAD